MLEIIIWSVLGILTIVGVVALISFIEMRVIYDNKHAYVISFLNFSGHVEDAEYQIRSAIAIGRWFNSQSTHTLYIIDDNMDNETRELCDLIIKDYDGVKILKREQIGSAISLDDIF